MYHHIEYKEIILMDRTKTTQCMHTYSISDFSPLHKLSSKLGVGGELEEGRGSLSGLLCSCDETASMKEDPEI